MSERLGPLTFVDGHQAPCLKGAGFPQERTFGEETARVIDEEVWAIVDRMHDRVRGILTAKKDLLTRAAEELKRTETLGRDRLRRLLAGELVEGDG